MATIDQFGNTSDPLSAPALGGSSGWAAAVRDSLNSKANSSHTHAEYSPTTHAHAGVYWTKWTGTQAAYDAIGTKDANTLYVVVG